MQKLCDRVIVSGDENWTYLDFWPFVAYAYRTIFPGTKITLALVSDRKCVGDDLISQLDQHGEVFVLPPVEGVPMIMQAKMARYYAATLCHGQVCYIDDLDQIPIDREWHLSKTMQRAPLTMLMVGSEVFGPEYNGQFPASMLTGEGELFAELFNPSNLTWSAFVKSFDGIYAKTMSPQFSDEELIVKLFEERPTPTTKIRRDYQPGADTIDRSWWPYDDGKLQSGGYLAAHTARPFGDYLTGNLAIMDYIRRRYEGAALPSMLRRP